MAGNYESWTQSEEKIKEVITNKLQLDGDQITIERAHRTGKKKPGKPRTIVAKFLSFKDREMILKSKRNLKGSRVSIREDFSERVNAKRKELLPKLQEARKEGKIAYLSYDKLVIRHSTRSSSNMNYGLAHLGCNQANSPPFLPPFSQSVRPSFPHHPVYVPQHVQQTIPITTLQHSEEQNELNPSQNFVNTNE